LPFDLDVFTMLISARVQLGQSRARFARREVTICARMLGIRPRLDTERQVPLPLTILTPALTERRAHDSTMQTANATAWLGLFPQHPGVLLVRPRIDAGDEPRRDR
jgi:hypothetical protein